MKFFTESDHARECQKEEGKMVTVHWTGIFWFINRTVYSPEKYLALYHVSCYVPKPRISSVKTPGSLSIKHHSPPPDAMMLDSTTQRSVPEVLLRLVPRVFSLMILPPDLETWKPTTLNIQDGECNDSLGSLYNEAKNISLFPQCGVSRCISYSKISCVSKKIAQRG